jgi:hypothetical protein
MTYESEYGALRRITAAQKAAEICCARIALFEKCPLPSRFWTEGRWKVTFSTQVKAASSLLLLYDEVAILATLSANPRIRSLTPIWVADLIAAEQASLDRRIREAERTAPIQTQETSSQPRPGVRRASGIRAKLEGL